jgi:hypothetical protein
MPPFPVILALDIFKNSQPGLLPGSKFPVVDQRCFHRFEKAFSHSVVPTISSPAHAL